MTQPPGAGTGSAQAPPEVAEPAVAPALVDGVSVDAVAAAVTACAGVAGMYSGRFGEIGTYLPGRRVSGVQVEADAVTVQVRSRWGVPAAQLLQQITAVTAPLTGGRSVHVVVADIDDPPDTTARPPHELTAGPALPQPGGDPVPRHKVVGPLSGTARRSTPGLPPPSPPALS